VCDGEHFRHPPCAKFSLARFSGDDHNHLFSSPYCVAQVACHYAAVIPQQVINLVFGLQHCCCVEHTCLSGAPLILVELDTVTVTGG
jgi:hypothetical protein